MSNVDNNEDCTTERFHDDGVVTVCQVLRFQIGIFMYEAFHMLLCINWQVDLFQKYSLSSVWHQVKNTLIIIIIVIVCTTKKIFCAQMIGFKM